MLRFTGTSSRSSFGALDETSQPIELLLSVRREGPQALGAQIEDQLRTRHPGRSAEGPTPASPRRGISRVSSRSRAGSLWTRTRSSPPRDIWYSARARARGSPRRLPPPARRAEGGHSPRPSSPFRLPAARTRCLQLSARRLATLPTRGARRDHRCRPRVRGPARRRGAAFGPRRLSRPGARRGRGPHERRRHVRVLAGPGHRLSGTRRVVARVGSRSRTPAIRSSVGSPPRSASRSCRSPVDENGIRVEELSRARRRRRRSHPGPSAPDRRGALRRTAIGPPRMAPRAECDCDRGRLRRGVPIRPRRGRRTARAAVGPDHLCRLGEQDTRSGAPAWLARATPESDGSREPREGHRRLRHGAHRAARLRGLHLAWRARPPPAADAHPVPAATRSAGRGPR